ncbi:MAG TPA: hypothetical protein VKA86_16305 [Candidatus Krumholzibacteria bacterium]|nr:hypothetical protein [Candidatus Krumholzibacteria bacterium]
MDALTHLLVGAAAQPLDPTRRAGAGALLARIGERHPQWWHGRFRMVAEHDLFVGWMTAPERAFDIVAALHLVCWPAAFHFRLHGAVDLPSSQRARAEMETLPVDALRDATADAVEEGLPLQLSLVARHLEPYQRVAERLARAHVRVTRSWTPRQHEIVLARRRQHGRAGLHHVLGCSRQVVHRALDRAQDDELRAIENALRDWITLAVHDQGLRRHRRRAVRLV